MHLGRHPNGAIVFYGGSDEERAQRITATPVHMRGVSFVNASPPQSPSGPHQRVLRSPSPVLVRAPDALRAHSASPPRRMEMSPTMMFRDPRQRSPTDSTLTFDQVEPGRIFQGRSAIDPVASRSRGVPCAAWAHKHPYQTVKMLDSVAEGQESAVSTDIRSPTIQSPRILNRQLVQASHLQKVACLSLAFSFATDGKLR